MCYQALNQLNIKQKVEGLGWDEELTKLAITPFIRRAVYSFSENGTTRWIKENSAVCEITGYPI